MMQAVIESDDAPIETNVIARGRIDEDAPEWAEAREEYREAIRAELRAHFDDVAELVQKFNRYHRDLLDSLREPWREQVVFSGVMQDCAVEWLTARYGRVVQVSTYRWSCLPPPST